MSGAASSGGRRRRSFVRPLVRPPHPPVVERPDSSRCEPWAPQHSLQQPAVHQAGSCGGAAPPQAVRAAAAHARTSTRQNQPPNQLGTTRLLTTTVACPLPRPACSESPQWRCGPPHKAILCNACGTRYRWVGLKACVCGPWRASRRGRRAAWLLATLPCSPARRPSPPARLCSALAGAPTSWAPRCPRRSASASCRRRQRLPAHSPSSSPVQERAGRQCARPPPHRLPTAGLC